jgi:hypothetical protein
MILDWCPAAAVKAKDGKPSLIRTILEPEAQFGAIMSEK